MLNSTMLKAPDASRLPLAFCVIVVPFKMCPDIQDPTNRIHPFVCSVLSNNSLVSLQDSPPAVCF